MLPLGMAWMPINQTKRVYLSDDDPALPPRQLKERLKKRVQAARKKARLEQAAHGLPPADGSPAVGGAASRHGELVTLLLRSHRGVGAAGSTLVNVELCDSGGAELKEAESQAEVAAVAREVVKDIIADVEKAVVVQAITDASNTPAIEAAIEATIEEAIEWAAVELAAAAEKAAANKAAALKRMEFMHAPTRNDGKEGFGTQLHEAADADSLEERICAICLEPAKTTMKACCGKGMHKACLAHWLRISGQRWPLGYGENAAYLVGEGSVDALLDCEVKPGRLVPHIRPDGRAAVTDHPVNTKTCPCCRKPIQCLARAGFDR